MYHWRLDLSYVLETLLKKVNKLERLFETQLGLETLFFSYFFNYIIKNRYSCN